MCCTLSQTAIDGVILVLRPSTDYRIIEFKCVAAINPRDAGHHNGALINWVILPQEVSGIWSETSEFLQNSPISVRAKTTLHQSKSWTRFELLV